MSATYGTKVGGPLVPTDTTDTYPTHDSAYGKGGWTSVADTTARDAITAERRTEGMVVYCVSDEKEYQLVNGITNTDWVEYGGGSGTIDGSGGEKFIPKFSASTSLANSVMYEDTSKIYIGATGCGTMPNSLTISNLGSEAYDGISIYSATNATGRISFGDTGSGGQGEVLYSHDSDLLAHKVKSTYVNTMGYNGEPGASGAGGFNFCWGVQKAYSFAVPRRLTIGAGGTGFETATEIYVRDKFFVNVTPTSGNIYYDITGMEDGQIIVIYNTSAYEMYTGSFITAAYTATTAYYNIDDSRWYVIGSGLNS